MRTDYRSRICRLMRERHITKHELGLRMGLTDTGVDHMLDDQDVPLGMLERAATALGVEVWELLASRQQVIASAASLRYDVVCPRCGRRVGLHLGISCEAMPLNKNSDR